VKSRKETISCIPRGYDTFASQRFSHPKDVIGDQVTPQPTTERQNSPPLFPLADPIEEALAQALAGAAADKRWDVVTELSRELTERRRAREEAALAPQTSVVDVADFRRAKREGR
jgi:hypothetical protein